MQSFEIDRGDSRHRRQAGRGIIGFLIAIVVVAVVGNAAWATFKVKRKADQMNDYVLETLQEATRAKLTKQDVHRRIVERARELEIPLEDAKLIEVTVDEARWRVHFEWEEDIHIPGYTTRQKFEVDKTWNVFDR